MKNILESIRRWIDGERAYSPPPTGEQPQTRRSAEDFVVKVIQEIGAVMEREMFMPPGGPAYIPRYFVVYMSSESDREWAGEKKKGMQRWLNDKTLERAQEITKQQFSPNSFTVDLRTDATLEPDEFAVRGVWDAKDERTKVPSPQGEETHVEQAEDEVPKVRPLVRA